MSTSRRQFLKTAAATSAALALPDVSRASTVSSGASSGVVLTEVNALTEAGGLFTRGVGMYPGLPAENFGPTLVPDTSGSYRNLALLRPAFHSSAYDYNLTAQLVTDGIKDARPPRTLTTRVDGQVLPKPDREVFVDHFPMYVMALPGASPTVEMHVEGGGELPVVDRVMLFAVVPDRTALGALVFTVSVSEDGHTWQQVGRTNGAEAIAKAVGDEKYPADLARGSHLLKPSIPLATATRARHWRIEFASEAGTPRSASAQWRVGQVEFHRDDKRVEFAGPYVFTSAWKSAGMDEEWVYVDLGAVCAFDRVVLHWIAAAAKGKLQASDDAEHWRDLKPLPAIGPDAGPQVSDVRIAPTRAHYVRVLMTRPASADGYVLSELEVFGHGGLVVKPHAAASADAEGRLDLAGGNWRLRREGEGSGEALSTPGFRDADWLAATVPGTTLTSYLNAGAIPDPNFGDNQLHISDSFFYADFWHRTEFIAPANPAGPLTMLHFDGVNWKAEVFLNGERLGRIDGGFMRGSFDVSGKLLPGKANALAVRVLKNATPGSARQKTAERTGTNGGSLGSDDPTYHASNGWDWIPTIRGRNTGLWGNVSLASSGQVTISDPLVSSVLPLPDTNHADVSISVVLTNHGASPMNATLRGRFGAVEFSQPVKLSGGASETVMLSPQSHPQLRIEKPELWWPVGYGEAHLYDVELRVEEGAAVLHRKVFKAGIRQMTSSEEGGALRLWINGRRFIARGGNWGFSESMLRFRAREYDAAVRYHREMNFTMIRNWVGQIGDDALYEACDRHGVVVWHDFWLANPWDGPIPDDNTLFLANARDVVARIRSHACVGLYCGRNEWFPPAALEAGLRKLLAELHPDIHYIPSSADGSVSGHGPYRAMDPPFYFRTADTKLHSELGAPAIPPIESVRAMMPKRSLWPQALDWGLHDFTAAGAQGGAEFRSMIDESYGGANSAEEWIRLAQFVCYDSYRAMFEAQAQHRMGLLLWMSHSCWPSFVWQTYDYYFEPTAAYFGCKKGSEPLHIQWNSNAETVEVVNYNAGDPGALEAEVEVLNLDGASKWKRSVPVRCAEDAVVTALSMEYPGGLSAVHCLRLTLRAGGVVRSSNFYLRGVEQGNYRAIRALRDAQVSSTTTKEQRGDRWLLTTRLRNASSWPALQVRLRVVRERSGDRILPAIYDDNYLALMPGEKRVVTVEVLQADTRGEAPAVAVSGFNVAAG